MAGSPDFPRPIGPETGAVRQAASGSFVEGTGVFVPGRDEFRVVGTYAQNEPFSAKPVS